jgi:hypothetical protein
MKVLYLLIDFGQILFDSLVVFITSFDVFLTHHEEELGNQLIVSDHFTSA